MKIHNKPANYECDECQETFNTALSLNVHKKKHKPEDASKQRKRVKIIDQDLDDSKEELDCVKNNIIESDSDYLPDRNVEKKLSNSGKAVDPKKVKLDFPKMLALILTNSTKSKNLFLYYFFRKSLFRLKKF